jgi:hypothetical protein
MDRRGKHLGKGAEAPDELLGGRLDVAAGNGAEQDELQKLVVGQRLAADLGEAGARGRDRRGSAARRRPIRSS